MSHTIAEEKKETWHGVYYLDIFHSGGLTSGEIRLFKKAQKEWCTYAKESGKLTEERLFHIWNSIK